MKTLKQWKQYFRDKYPTQSDSKITELAQNAFNKQQETAAQTSDVPTLESSKGDGTQSQVRGIPVGFGLTDSLGNPLYLAPSRFPSYMQELSLTNPTVYKILQKKVYESSNRKYSDPNDLGTYLQGISQNQLSAVRQNPALAGFDLEKILNIGAANRASNPLFAKGGGKYTPLDIEAVSGATTAQKLITDIWKKQLNREPTAEEITFYTDKLQKAQKKNPAKQTYEMVGGKRVQKTVSGLNEEQYLTNQARKLPEYSKKTAEEARIAESNKQVSLQTLAKVAAANGLDLNKNFGDSVQDWVNRIANGESIEVFKNLIRQTAKTGMPEYVGKLLDQGVDLQTIVEPYKRLMASTLEINPDSITLDDPTLRSALGGYSKVTAQPGMGGVSRGEYGMTLYDFQRELRKDPRWQYTDNARQDVSNAALTVLKDFGFQG